VPSCNGTVNAYVRLVAA
jgi:Transposase DDE domain